MKDNLVNESGGLVNDCISRQAAIVAAKDALLAWSSMPEWRVDKITEALVELPSAQPGIIRCKDCYWHSTCKHEQYLGLEGYCSKAEEK